MLQGSMYRLRVCLRCIGAFNMLHKGLRLYGFSLQTLFSGLRAIGSLVRASGFGVQGPGLRI